MSTLLGVETDNSLDALLQRGDASESSISGIAYVPEKIFAIFWASGWNFDRNDFLFDGKFSEVM